MPITREVIVERIERLKKQAELFRQQYNITMGAIAEAEFWLSQNDVPKED